MVRGKIFDGGLFTINQVSMPKEELEQFAAFRAAVVLNAAAPPTLLGLGVTGNVMTLLVLTCSSLRHTACCKYLAAVAVTDCCILVLNFCFHFVDVFVQKVMDSDVVCKLYHFLFFTSVHLSVWLLVAVTAQRCFVICRPMTSFMVTSNRFTLSVIGGLTLFSVLMNCHHLFVRQLVWSERSGGGTWLCYTAGESNTKFVHDVWPWVDASIYCFLPAVCLIFLNTILVRTLRKAAVFRKRHQRYRHVSDIKTNRAGRVRRRPDNAGIKLTAYKLGDRNSHVSSQTMIDPLSKCDTEQREEATTAKAGIDARVPLRVIPKFVDSFPLPVNCEFKTENDDVARTDSINNLSYCPQHCTSRSESEKPKVTFVSERKPSLASPTTGTCTALPLVLQTGYLLASTENSASDSPRRQTPTARCASVYEIPESNITHSDDMPGSCTLSFGSDPALGNYFHGGMAQSDRRKPVNRAHRFTGTRDQPETHARSRQLTLMPLLASLVFLLLSAPLAVVLLVEQLAWERTSPNQVAMYSLVRMVVNTLMYTNHSVNFLLYCFAGSTFRSEWYALFCRPGARWRRVARCVPSLPCCPPTCTTSPGACCCQHTVQSAVCSGGQAMASSSAETTSSVCRVGQIDYGQ